MLHISTNQYPDFTRIFSNLSIQDSDGHENGLSSDDFTPSPSDEEFEHTLDCGPQTSDGQDPPTPDSAEESRSDPEEPAPEQETTAPIPKPRLSQQTTPSLQPSPPTPKPRTVLLFNPSCPRSSPPPVREMSKATPDSRPKQSLRKLQLTDEEKHQLINLQSFSADSDSETPGGSSSCSSSSVTAGGPSPPKPEGLDGQEEEGYWSGSTAGHIRDKRNRRCFRRKEMPSGQPRVRSKFSPWNLSSPRISRDTRLSVLINHPGKVGE